MKSFWLSYAVLACLVVAPRMVAQPTSAGERSGTLEQNAITNEKALIEAKKKDDAGFFRRTLSGDFSLVGVDGKLLQRQEAADNLGDSGLVELTAYDVKVVALGDDGAIVSYDAIVREKPEEDQGPPPRYQHFSSVWLRQGDQWKLKFHQATAAHWGDW